MCVFTFFICVFFFVCVCVPYNFVCIHLFYNLHVILLIVMDKHLFCAFFLFVWVKLLHGFNFLFVCAFLFFCGDPCEPPYWPGYQAYRICK